MATSLADRLKKRVSADLAERGQFRRVTAEDLGGVQFASTSSRKIPLSMVRDSPFQPRDAISEAHVDNLATSMAQSVLATPISVRPIIDAEGEIQFYELLDGAHRTAAARSLNWEEIDAFIREMSDSEAHQLVVIANIHRLSYSDFETGRAFRRMLAEGVVSSQTEIERLTGLDRSVVSRLVALSDLGEPLDSLMRDHPTLLTYNYADLFKAILAYPERGAELAKEAFYLLVDGFPKDQLRGWWKQRQKQLEAASSGQPVQPIAKTQRTTVEMPRATVKVARSVDGLSLKIQSTTDGELDVAAIEKKLMEFLGSTLA